jgi:DNA-binding NarL/FixJ family response regulator
VARAPRPIPARLYAWLLLSERAILLLLASGLTNAGIAERLSLVEGTVRNHVTSILGNLGVDDRAQATALAWSYGLVTPEG